MKLSATKASHTIKTPQSTTFMSASVSCFLLCQEMDMLTPDTCGLDKIKYNNLAHMALEMSEWHYDTQQMIACHSNDQSEILCKNIFNFFWFIFEQSYSDVQNIRYWSLSSFKFNLGYKYINTVIVGNDMQQV